MVLIKAGNLPTDETSHCFRPLAGIMVLIAMLLQHMNAYDGCFRPLAGIMVLITKTSNLSCTAYYPFPSPCGDYGSYRRQTGLQHADGMDGFRPLAGIMVLIRQKVEEVNESKRQFPSPCGDYGSYLNREEK